MEKLKVIWSEASLDDLDQIYFHISKDSKKVASNIIKNIVDYSENVTLFPKSGRVIPLIKIEKYRETFIESFRLMYKVEEKQITILGVVHMSMDFNLEEFRKRVKD